MIELSAQRGYPNVSVADVSAHAGVSTKTFYELFRDKEDCLLVSYRSAAARLLTHTEPLAQDGDWEEAAFEVLTALLEALGDEPDAGRLLLVEALAGSERVREERDRVLVLLEARAGRFLEASTGGKALDLPASAVLGAVRSIVSRHLRTSSADRLPDLVGDLLAWLQSYAIPARRQPWSTGPHSLLPLDVVVPLDATHVAPAPPPLPRGRHRLAPDVIARSQRTRIIRGTAEVMMLKGYAETTVSEIVAAAGISREVFYAHFENKQNAYLAAQQYGTHYVLETCTRAYFAAASWPERVWAALSALIDMLVANPALAHLRLVECYAAGGAAIENTEELKRSVTIFLEEGFSGLPPGSLVPRVAGEAIAGVIFEAFYSDLARGDFDHPRRRLPELTYVAIAPFVGPASAIKAVERLRDRAIAKSS
jgi:AcrR family transcriptional regulator